MSKLYFRYGCMNSSKTANALMTKHNYEEKGRKVLLMKPHLDTRTPLVSSRIGIEAPALSIYKHTDLMSLFVDMDWDGELPDVVIIDEVQFLEPSHVESLFSISRVFDIPVMAYGLKTDYTHNLFPASKKLIEIADSIKEIKSICHCGEKAVVNAKFADNKIIYEGEDVIDVGGEEKYIGLCYSCWKIGNLGEM